MPIIFLRLNRVFYLVTDGGRPLFRIGVSQKWKVGLKDMPVKDHGDKIFGYISIFAFVYKTFNEHWFYLIKIVIYGSNYLFWTLGLPEGLYVIALVR